MSNQPNNPQEGIMATFRINNGYKQYKIGSSLQYTHRAVLAKANGLGKIWVSGLCVSGRPLEQLLLEVGSLIGRV